MNAFGSTSMFLLLSIGNKLLTTQENQNVIFCEYADLHMNCPMNTEIKVKSVTNENEQCKQNGENEECLGQLDTLINLECSMKNNCTLSADEFDKQGCSRIPKRIKAQYTCTCLWIRSISKENDICANSLEKINCDGLCHTFATKLVINRIQNHEAFCQQCSNRDVKKYVGTLCKDTRCASPQNNNNCLFHQRFVKVEYSCEGDNMWTALLLNTSTEPTESITSNNANTSFTYVTPETSVHSTDGTTVIIETPPKVQLDMQGRVLIYNPVDKKTFAVCGNQWDENDAKVLCNYLDENSYGFAYQLQANKNMNFTLQIEFQCTGNETGLFKCTTKFYGYGCEISTIAAAKCCKADSDLSECSKDTSSMTASTTSKRGLIIGLVLGFLLLACVVILIILFLRRFIGPKKKRQKQNSASSRNDYIGTQGIAIPVANEHRPPYPGLEIETRNGQYQEGISDINNASNKNISDPNKYAKLNNKNKNFSGQKIHNNSAIPDQSNETVLITNSQFTDNNYVVLDPNETGFNRSEGPDKMNGSYELAQPIHHIYISKDAERKRETSNDVYAHSEEGVYDSSNGNRHKESESNIYSRAVDNVYDSSNHTRKNGETEDNYDHFSGKKTDDDYDISQI